MVLHLDTAALGLPAIAVHGGAGTFSVIRSEDDLNRLSAGLESAVATGWRVLEGGGSSLEAVVEAVSSMESSGLFNAGRGAVPTSGGSVEFDSSVMDGETGAVGALCSVTYPANPIRAALRLSERGGGVPDGPILLAGEGADRFCREEGLDQMRPEWLTAWQEEPAGTSEEGTVGAVAVDPAGRLAAATSTGGRAGQWPGRVGDSPIPGAGVLAKKETVAVSATGTGEAFLVAGFAHQIAWGLAGGSDLSLAMTEALETVGQLKGSGGAVALGPGGEMVAGFTTPAMARAWRAAGAFETRIFPVR